MKNLLNILLLFILAIGCKAQSPIFDISETNGTKNQTGAYYKDLNNIFGPFEGTYLYINGNTSFKIVLQKKEMSAIANNRYYFDCLVGEYQYIENNIEKVNTLDRIYTNYTDQGHHNIFGRLIITQGQIGCDDCLPNEKAVRGGLFDPVSGWAASIIIRRITVNNRPAIKIWVGWETGTSIEGQPAPRRPSFKGTYYTLIKQ